MRSPRGRVDAIIVGVGTVLRDDPLLTCRAGRPQRIATRIVLDTHLRTPLRAQLVRTARQLPTRIFCGPDAPVRRARALEQAGCVVQRIARTRDGLSLPAVLDALGRQQVADGRLKGGNRLLSDQPMTNVLVEGGGTLLGRFFDQRLADELHVYVAPLLIGGRAAPGPLNSKGAATVAGALRLPWEASLRRLGSGYLFQTRLPPR